MHDAAVLIAKNLKFDVMRVDDELFNVDLGIAKGLVRFQAGRMVALHQASFIARDAHAASSASGHRFDHHGKSHLARDLDGLLLAVDRAVASRRNRNAGVASAVARRVLVAHQPNG